MDVSSSSPVRPLSHPSAARRPLLTSLTAALLLCACVQGPAPVPTVPATGSAPGAPGASVPQLSSAEATSATSLLLVFSAPVGASAADARHYTLTDDAGATLEVVAAYVAADGLSVHLATKPQSVRTYTVTLSGVTGKGGQNVSGQKSFSGSAVAAPVLSDVVVLSDTELLLSFNDPVTGLFSTLGQNALDRAAYSLSPEVDVKGVRLSQDAGSVIITTSELKAATYTVSVKGVLASPVTAKTAPLIDPQRSQATFQRLPTIDSVRPILKRVVPLSATKVQLIFSEPVTADAADLSKYLIRDAGGTVLGVSGAALSEFRTAVTLTTTAQGVGTAYTITSPDVQDLAGNPLDPASTLKFSGYSGLDAGSADTTPPRVAGAVSRSATSVLVTFSEPVRGGASGAENVKNYRITGLENTGASTPATGTQSLTGVKPQAAELSVRSAVLQPGGTSVLLTTLAQSDIKYELQVAGVQDLAGNQIAAPDRGVDPGKAIFTGMPVSGGGTDTDGDGLSDASEQRGWTVSVTTVSGQVRKYQVTSDPTLADTDNDGFSDQDEITNATDPRLADTDNDQIKDADEYNKVFSSPTNADTDGDTITDGAEANFFASSPLLADTDGDGIRDDAETLSPLRNPLIADLPTPQLTVSGVDLKLDVRFTATQGNSSRQLESRSTQTTLTQGRSTSEEYSSARTSEWFTKAGAFFSATFNSGGNDTNIGFPRWTLSGGGSVESGGGGSTAMTFTRGSVEQSQQEYASSLNTEKEIGVEETVTREVSAAQLSAGVTFRTSGTVAFTMKNVEVTAYLTDPFSPGKLVPVATLKAEGDSGVNGVSLGPANPVRGPLRFVSVQAYPAMVEQLMQNPENLVFRITNYDLTDEQGRNFAYTSQQVKERTAEINIDFGGGTPAEHYNVATYSFYGDDGRQTGISLPYILENILKLKHVDHAQDTTISGEALMNSYSTATIPGGQVLTRVRDVYIKDSTNYPQRWFINLNNTNQNSKSIDTINIRAGDIIDLMFTEDADNDGMLKAVEDLYGSSDKMIDSDGDSLSDPEEVFGVLDASGKRRPRTIIAPDGTSIPTVSSPTRKDSDYDGLDDVTEYTKMLDPSNPDTDGDHLSDGDEETGLMSRDYFSRNLVQRTSDPKKRDTDGDGLDDASELRIGLNPKTADFDRVIDSDGDGLTNAQEKEGWTVTLPTGPVQVTSNPQFSDSDDDGLNDKQERDARSDPTKADTDGDGLSDREEVMEYKTNHAAVDTDGDGLSDFTEIKEPWVPNVEGNTTSVFTNPLLTDTDYDGLPDKKERELRTNPTAIDSDGDKVSDYYEVVESIKTSGISSNPLVKNKIIHIRLIKVLVKGSCDVDDKIDLKGQFKSSTFLAPNDVREIKNFDELDPIREGTEWKAGENIFHVYDIRSNDGLKVFTTNMRDSDDDVDDQLENLDENISYDQIEDRTSNKDLIGIDPDDKDGSCTVNITYSLTWFRNPN